MPIRIVLNGFFRSGTTFVWDWLRQAMPESPSFYEPLHPDLSRLLERETRTGLAHPEHGRRLWESYAALDPALLQRLLALHPNTGRRGIEGNEALFRYLDLFHAMPEAVVLQPVRASPLLGPIAERYEPRLVHIVRHPFDVALSIERLAHGGRHALVRWLRRPLWRSRALRHMDLLRISRWLQREIDNRGARSPGGLAAAASDAGFLGLFLFVWIRSNRLALQAIDRHGGAILVYEEMLVAPRSVRSKLEKTLQTALGEEPAVRPRSPFGFASQAWNEALRTIERLGLGEDFDEICHTVRDVSGVDYRRANLGSQSVTTHSGGPPPSIDQR